MNNKKRHIFLFITLVLLITGLFIIAEITKSRRRIDLRICTLQLPDGWVYEIPENGSTILYFQGKMSKTNVLDDTLEDSSGGLSYKAGVNTKSLFDKSWYEFMLKHDSQEKMLTVDGKRIFALRYIGQYYFGEGKRILTSEFPTITISLYSDFGFYGAFFGFPEEEGDFWEMIDSIKWEELKGSEE